MKMSFFLKCFDWFTMQTKVQKNALDSRTRTRTSTRFDCPFLAKILRWILLFVRSTGCSVILVAGNWAFLLIEKCQNCYDVLDLFCHDNIFAKPRTKMTTVSSFSRQNDAGLRALTVVLWENLALVVVLFLESKALYMIKFPWLAISFFTDYRTWRMVAMPLSKLSPKGPSQNGSTLKPR